MVINLAISADRIELQPYDPSWPERYEAELARIMAVLPGGLIRRAEHIGSTAVPGMLAKPVVDALLAVDDLEQASVSFPPILEKLGYAFWGDNPKRDRLFFVKGLPPNGPRTFHIHVTTPSSAMWDRALFRDYLRVHADEARRYERLKMDLAAKYPDDREAYSEGKAEYHESVVAKARSAGQEMKAEDVVAVVELLEANGIAIWVDGGWGVDALLGLQTRPHNDLDIAIQHKDVPGLRELLGAQGYREVSRGDTKEWNFVLADGRGHEVDVHSYTLDGSGRHIYGAEYPENSLTGTGSINGRTVTCISADYMVRLHRGYNLRETDIRDVRAIHQRFGITLPKEYGGWPKPEGK